MSNKINSILSNIPNVAMEDVPVGKDEKSNKIIKTHGDPKKFEFKIKSHVDLGKDNMSFDIASKLSGSRFVVLKDKLALLERALIYFMLEVSIIKNYLI